MHKGVWYIRERDALLGIGASGFLQEKMLKLSDDFQCYICNKCGKFANGNSYCIACTTDDVSKISIPYSAKLLLQEILSVGIGMKFKI